MMEFIGGLAVGLVIATAGAAVFVTKYRKQALEAFAEAQKAVKDAKDLAARVTSATSQGGHQ